MTSASLSTIVHLNKGYPPQIGGVEEVCSQYANISKSVFLNVKVLSIGESRGFSWQIEKDDEIEVIRCGYQFKIGGHKFSFQLILMVIWLSLSRPLFHLHEPFPLGSLALAISWRPTFVATYHSDIVRQKKLKRFVQPIQRLMLHRAAVITVTSRNLLENSETLKQVDSKKIVVLPLFLQDAESMTKPLPTEELTDGLTDILSLKPYALVLGRMNYYKGLGVIEASLRHLEENSRSGATNIVIAGKNVDDTANLQSQRLRKFQNVTRLNFELTKPDKSFLLQHCSFLLFSSNKPSEAFGIVQLEALAAGKPVVNFDLPTGVPTVGLHGVTGVTLAVDDYVALSEVLVGSGPDSATLESITKNNISEHLNLFSEVQLGSCLRGVYQHASSIYKK